MKKLVFLLFILSGLIISCNNADVEAPALKEQKVKSFESIEEMGEFYIKQVNKRTSLSPEQVEKIKAIGKELEENSSPSDLANVQKLKKQYRERVKNEVLTEEQVNEILGKKQSK